MVGTYPLVGSAADVVVAVQYAISIDLVGAVGKNDKAR